MSRFTDLLNYIDTNLEETVKPFEEPVKEDLNMDGYNENAKDRDGDGLVQEGTPFERPVSTKTARKKTK